MDNRTNTRPLHEAVEDQLIGWIIGLERVTSVLRLVQTLIVLLEWLLPLLEDVRLSANQRDIIAMFRDHPESWKPKCRGRLVRCVSVSWADTTGHCKVEIPVTH